MQEAEDKANLPELNKERGINPHGDIIERDIPQIDLTSFKERKLEITDSLWNAAKDCGFFQLINHGIPPDQVTRAFYLTENFFDLPKQDKSEFPLLPGTNAGWEYMAQIRPSTGVEDKKQIDRTIPRVKERKDNSIRENSARLSRRPITPTTSRHSRCQRTLEK